MKYKVHTVLYAPVIRFTGDDPVRRDSHDVDGIDWEVSESGALIIAVDDDCEAVIFAPGYWTKVETRPRLS